MTKEEAKRWYFLGRRINSSSTQWQKIAAEDTFEILWEKSQTKLESATTATA